MNKKLLAVLIIAGLAIGLSTNQYAEAQEIELVEGVELNTTQVIYIIIIGGVAGVIVAWQGYDKSPNDFDKILFINGVRDAVLASIPIALTTALTMELNAVGYVIVFFAAMGLGDRISKARKASIPSNATPEEIQAILDARSS